jgi:5-methyltetrahydrofolate--homocysteine methyltransferase
VIEVDGAIHDTRQVYDANRTEWLNSIGLKVIRFQNEEILTNLNDVKDKILETLEQSKI